MPICCCQLTILLLAGQKGDEECTHLVQTKGLDNLLVSSAKGEAAIKVGTDPTVCGAYIQRQNNSKSIFFIHVYVQLST